MTEPDYDAVAEKSLAKQSAEAKELARRALMDKAHFASRYLGLCIEMCGLRDDEALALMLDRFVEAAREIAKLRGQFKP